MTGAMMFLVQWVIVLVFVAQKNFTAGEQGQYREDGNETFSCSLPGQIMRGQQGIIRSPGFQISHLYPPDSHCFWAFPKYENKFIRFHFLNFDLEVYNDCQKDRLDLISTTSKGAKLLRRFCGNFILDDLILPSEWNVSLEFYSDDLFEHPGFEIEYTIEDEDTRMCNHGWFRCRNTKCVPEANACNKVDDCRDGSDEETCDHDMLTSGDCGIPAIDPLLGNGLDRIIGGKESVQGSWPWQISIHKASTYPSGHFCGGALVDRQWIVTAGHCVQSQSIESLRIHLGSHHEFKEDEEEVIRYPRKIIPHPNFMSRSLKSDIALIKMNAPVSFSKAIGPVCLPSKANEPILLNGSCIVTGWGTTYGSGNAGVLKQAFISITSNMNCQTITKKKLPIDTLCSGFKGQAPCFGDSGGPVVCSNSGKWVLVGVVSTGPQICGISNEPSIFTRIVSYLDWITNTIQNN